MPSRALVVGTAAMLLWGCTDDGGDTDRESDGLPIASSSTSPADTTAAPDDAGPDAGPRVSVGVARGWSARVTGADAAELPAVGGLGVLVSRTPARTTLTGMVGEAGGALTIGLETLEIGENPAHDFNLGFRLHRFRCIGQDVVVTLTEVEPRPKGTFTGPVSCEDLDGPSDPIEATVSGEIAG